MQVNKEIIASNLREMELPDRVLAKALEDASEGTQIESLYFRPVIQPSVTELVLPFLRDNGSQNLTIAALEVLQRQNSALSKDALKAITARFEDKESDIRKAAIDALKG